MRAVVITVSTSAAAGDADDLSGPKLAQLIVDSGLVGGQVENITVADNQGAIVTALNDAISSGANLVLTTGGTGFSTDDVTPEATREVIDREAPGLAEAIRADAAKRITTGILTRGIAGIAGSTLIINLPGSPKAVEESFAVLAPVLPHALAQLGGTGGRDRH
jgi:molybdenum cofactor synthesis domain-containing protein